MDNEITLETLPDKIRINPVTTAIIVVDMQNAFVTKGGYFDLVGFDLSATEKIIGPCKEIISAGREKGMKVIYLQMGYSQDLSDSGGPNSPSFYKSRALTLMRERPELKDRLQIYGTWGADIIDELKPRSGDIVVKKQKHDGFIGTNLDIILKTYDVKHLLFIGTATNICVESTLRHASSLGYFPILVSDATSPLGSPSSQEAAIFNIQSIFGWVITSEKLLSAIRGLQRSFSGRN
jgi:ureidoacrylate peracid hydrolase